MRHLISGIDCAIAGAAIVAAPAALIPVTLRKSLRFMVSIPVDYACQPSYRGLRPAWRIRFRISIPYGSKNAKSPVSQRDRAGSCDFRFSLPARARADHERVEGVFGNLPPQILVGTVGLHRVDRLLEVGVLGGEFGPQLVGRLQAGLQHFVGEGTKLRATGDQTLQR